MPRRLLLAIALITTGTACGASIQAVYEGDVRFEHCMALDSRQGVKSTLRSACWEEWVTFYTFGQTLDRVEYAKLRQKQLLASSDFDEGDWALTARGRPAVPEPTSALAPPPMTLASDGGPPASNTEPEDAGADAESDAQILLPPGAACRTECDELWTLCRKECAIPACTRGCEPKHKRCMRKCL